MKPGVTKVGQRIRTIVPFQDFPQFPVGSVGEIKFIIEQAEGADRDAVGIHLDADSTDDVIACTTTDIELETEQP